MKNEYVRVGIVGCEGKLAKEIIKAINETDGCVIAAAITYKESEKIGSYLFDEICEENVVISESILDANECDVYIDATNRDAFMNDNYNHYMTISKPLIIATTGFSKSDNVLLSELARRTIIVKSPNYSFELVYFIEAIKQYAKIVRDIDVAIVEEHHKEKLDRPSGTALRIKEAITKVNSNLNIEISSIRAGKIHGEHKVIFANSLGEEIVFSHKVTDRKTFAYGIVKVLLQIQKKDNGMYTIEDFIDYT